MKEGSDTAAAEAVEAVEAAEAELEDEVRTGADAEAAR